MIYEVIVIGAGVEGSATGYYLTSRGTKNVLLLEQFDAIHTRGSSHGGSRMAHDTYREQFYVDMMHEGYEMWKEIEERSGKKLYTKTGLLGFGTSAITSFSTALQSNNVRHKTMTGREVNEIYSNQLQLPDEYMCILSENGGMIKAAHAVATLQELFVRYGGKLLARHRVTGIIPGDLITVQTNKGSFEAKKVIITAGAWTGQLVEGTGLTLPLQPEKIEALYWSAINPDVFTPDSFPVFLYINEDEYFEFYGLPIDEYHGLLRIGCHYGSKISDPEKRDNEPHNNRSQLVSQFIQKHFKGVDAKPAVMEFCVLTVTPDSYPIMDRHPVHHNIIIGAGFSGKGFKYAPVVGNILSDLALGHPPSHDLSPFKIDRFKVARSRL